MNDQSNLPASMQDGGPPRMAAMPAGGIPTAIVPRTFEEVYRLAGLLASSGLTPYGMNTPEKCAVALMHGLELGLKPMQAIQSIAVIGGRPTIWGDVAMAMIRASGELEEFDEEYIGTPYEPDYAAVCTMKRKGQKAITRRFSVAQAQLAGLWTKKNRDGTPGVWMLYPDRMLMRRARSQTQTDGFQDILKGFSIAEDLQDAIDVTPGAPEVPPAPVSVERPRQTRAKKAQEERGATPDQMEAAARVAGPDTVDESIENGMSDARVRKDREGGFAASRPDGINGEKLPQTEEATQREIAEAAGAADPHGAEIDADNRNTPEGDTEGEFAEEGPDWDEVKQHFKADLLACTDVGSCEVALEGVLARYDGMPEEVERILCESHDARVKQIAEAAQLRLQKQAEKAAPKEEPTQAAGPKKKFASSSEAEKAVDGVASKLRQSKSTQQLQGAWDSHVVPFMAEYEVSASDVQGLEQIFNARMKILKRKEA